MTKTFVMRVVARLLGGAKRKGLLRVLDLKREGDVEEAYRLLNRVLLESPRLSENADVQVLRGELELFVNDNVAEAREALKKARELGCRDWGSYYKVHGDLMGREGKFEEAAQDYRQSIALSPDVPTMTLLAEMLSMSQDQGVVAVCQEILEKDPSNCYAYIYLGWNAVQSGNASEAQRLADKARESAHSPEDFVELARLYYETDNFQIALDVYLEADRLGFRWKGFLYACIAACHLSLEQISLARKYIELATSLNPNDEYLKEVMQAYEKRIAETGEDQGYSGAI